MAARSDSKAKNGEKDSLHQSIVELSPRLAKRCVAARIVQPWRPIVADHACPVARG
jgi:hypothetical protein